MSDHLGLTLNDLASLIIVHRFCQKRRQQGLSEDNKNELLAVANAEAESNQGMPAIFAVCEAVRAWLADNNVKGLDDASMHAQMMRKAKEAERKEVSISAIILSCHEVLKREWILVL